MIRKSEAGSFPLPKLAPELLRGRRISDPTDYKAAKSVKAIAKIVGAGVACVPTSYIGGRVIFKRSKKLKGLVGHATCVGENVTLTLCKLSLDAAAAVLATLVLLRNEGTR